MFAPAAPAAKYVDTRMRGGARAAGVGSEEELEAVLDRVMTLFRCLHGKDVFEAFYKKDLSKRLLLGRSASSDLERAMVGKLKTECGSQFTAKLEGMFRDADGSKELMAQFAASPPAATLPFDLSVYVLTSSYWPAYPPAPAIVPTALAAGLAAFEAFYGHKFAKGRRLTWQHQLGTCVVKAAFPSVRSAVGRKSGGGAVAADLAVASTWKSCARFLTLFRTCGQCLRRSDSRMVSAIGRVELFRGRFGLLARAWTLAVYTLATAVTLYQSIGCFA